MNLFLRDNLLVSKKVVDIFSSLIWVDRFDQWGDVELFVLLNMENLSMFQKGYYLSLESSEHEMIIESIEIISETEEGKSLRITGRSLESIMDRRLVWEQTILSGNLQTEIQRLLNENAISPTISERDIPNLVFSTSVDPEITSLTVDGQYTGDSLYVVISDLCKANNIGFKIILDSDTGNFVFSLYAGEDRSYAQVLNPYVVFSPNFDNIIESNYFTSDVIKKTVALVLGEGEGTARLNTVCFDSSGGGSGLDRRELLVDARDLSKTTSGGTLTTPEYLELLNQRGVEQLANYTTIASFEGEVESTVLFVYGEDFFMGDIIQIENEMGQGGRYRITELILSESKAGKNIRPTFKNLD